MAAMVDMSADSWFFRLSSSHARVLRQKSVDELAEL